VRVRGEKEEKGREEVRRRRKEGRGRRDEMVRVLDTRPPEILKKM
jgi:hypothetical protein